MSHHIVTVYIPPGKTLNDAIVHIYGDYVTRSKAQTALKHHIEEHERFNGPMPEGGQLIRKIIRKLDG